MIFCIGIDVYFAFTQWRVQENILLSATSLALRQIVFHSTSKWAATAHCSSSVNSDSVFCPLKKPVWSANDNGRTQIRSSSLEFLKAIAELNGGALRVAIRESSEEQLAALLLVLGNIYVGNVKVYEGSRELRRCKNSTVSLAGRDEHEAEKTTGRKSSDCIRIAVEAFLQYE